MRVDIKGHTALIRDTRHDCPAVTQSILSDAHQFGALNLIIDLSKHEGLLPADLAAFEPLQQQRQEVRKSLVFVAPQLDIEALDERWVIVPTVLEAHDLIEMDEIERDLGF